MYFHCPDCQRPLYNRRRKTCEFCNTPIPPVFRLTGRQMAAIDRMKSDESRQHRDFMTRPDPGLGGLGMGGGLGVDLMF